MLRIRSYCLLVQGVKSSVFGRLCYFALNVDKLILFKIGENSLPCWVI